MSDLDLISRDDKVKGISSVKEVWPTVLEDQLDAIEQYFKF